MSFELMMLPGEYSMLECAFILNVNRTYYNQSCQFNLYTIDIRSIILPILNGTSKNICYVLKGTL